MTIFLILYKNILFHWLQILKFQSTKIKYFATRQKKNVDTWQLFKKKQKNNSYIFENRLVSKKISWKSKKHLRCFSRYIKSIFILYIYFIKDVSKLQEYYVKLWKSCLCKTLFYCDFYVKILFYYFFITNWNLFYI